MNRIDMEHKKVLITGASGFLGKIICDHLNSADVLKVGRNADSDIVYDFSKGEAILPSSDLVIHCAGLAHKVPKTEEEKQFFFGVNVQGTLNLLASLKKAPTLPGSFVFMSSVAVYGKSQGHLISEQEPTLAVDAYGISKIQAERLILEWCEENKVTCTILRLPLIAGPTPPGNLKAMINGIKNRYYFNIGGGKARKSMVLAEDIALIIPVASKIGGIYNLTDGYHPSFSELSSNIANQLGKAAPLTIPHFLAQTLAWIGDIVGKKSPINSDKLKKIVTDLTFDDAKARKVLGWNPTPVLQSFKIK